MVVFLLSNCKSHYKWAESRVSRIKHKIAAVLTLFGGLVMASAALAQTTGSAGGEATIEVLARAPTIAATQSLEFGEVFRPATISESFGVVCGSSGAPTAEPLNLRAGGSPQCGQVNLTPGDTTVSLNLRFGGNPATALTLSGGSDFLQTAYTLTNAASTDLVTGHRADGTLISPPSVNFNLAPGAVQEFYIGGNVLIPPDATPGLYTGTYEVLFTIVR